jgi:hypothetical protein
VVQSLKVEDASLCFRMFCRFNYWQNLNHILAGKKV